MGPVTAEFMERVKAKCPSDHVLIVAYGKQIFELVEIKYGSFFLRRADGFVLTEGEPTEMNNKEITSYWYLPRHG